MHLVRAHNGRELVFCLTMWIAVIDASRVLVILTSWGIFVVSAAVLQWHGVVLCVMCGGHAGKLSFSPLPALGWGE